MNFRPRVTGRSLEYKLNRTCPRTEPWERPLLGVSKNWCHCPCAPWNVDLEAADPPVGWTNMACFYSVCKEDQCARQCRMLLLSPERPRQSLGSAGIHFRWKWWGQQPDHKCFNFSFTLLIALNSEASAMDGFWYYRNKLLYVEWMLNCSVSLYLQIYHAVI